MKNSLRRASAMTALMLFAFFLIPASAAHAHPACGANYHQSGNPVTIRTPNGTPRGSIHLYVSSTGHRWCGIVTKINQSVAQGIAVTIEVRETDRANDSGMRVVGGGIEANRGLASRAAQGEDCSNDGEVAVRHGSPSYCGCMMQMLLRPKFPTAQPSAGVTSPGDAVVKSPTEKRLLLLFVQFPECTYPIQQRLDLLVHVHGLVNDEGLS